MVQTPIIFGFGTMESVMAKMHNIADTKRTKFQARLKNLHRLGFPLNFVGAKGRASEYTPGQLVEIAIALEMTQLGLPPERVVKVLTLNRYRSFAAIRLAAAALIKKPEGFDPDEVLEDDPLSMFVFFDPSALSSLADSDPDDDESDMAHATFHFGGSGIVRDKLVQWTTSWLNRLSLINVTAMIDTLADFSCPKSSYDDDAALLAFRMQFFVETEAWTEAIYDDVCDTEIDVALLKIFEQSRLSPNENDDYVALARQLGDASDITPEVVEKAMQTFSGLSTSRASKGGE